MTTFSVNPDELGRVGDNLNSLGPTMQKMKSAGSGDHGAVGGSDIENGVAGFAKTWNYGAGLLEKHVETISKNVVKAGTNYAQNEANIIQKARNVGA